MSKSLRSTDASIEAKRIPQNTQQPAQQKTWTYPENF